MDKLQQGTSYDMMKMHRADHCLKNDGSENPRSHGCHQLLAELRVVWKQLSFSLTELSLASVSPKPQGLKIIRASDRASTDNLPKVKSRKILLYPAVWLLSHGSRCL